MSPSTKTNWETKFANEAPDFRGKDLSGEIFSNTTLPEQDFGRAILRNSEFVGCDLTGTNFADADLSGANFRGAKLEGVNFSNADLSRTNLYRASLLRAVFVGANLYCTIFREAKMGQTVFAQVDMGTCVGLDEVQHKAPSSIAVDCLYRLGGNLPMRFLKGVGFPGVFFDYLPSLIEAGSPIQFHSCFISYSHTDEAFARRLWDSMRRERIRVWYAPEEMKGGRKLFDQIDRAIHMHDKILIVLSKASMASDWVQTEIRRARKQEKLKNERKLFPIRLCDMDTLKGWECFDSDSGRDIAIEIREYFIPDFSDWRSEGKFGKAFERLRQDLRREGVTTGEG